jgi:hypothetical protein
VRPSLLTCGNYTSDIPNTNRMHHLGNKNVLFFLCHHQKSSRSRPFRSRASCCIWPYCSVTTASDDDMVVSTWIAPVGTSTAPRRLAAAAKSGSIKSTSARCFMSLMLYVVEGALTPSSKSSLLLAAKNPAEKVRLFVVG